MSKVLINKNNINKAVWSACDIFRGTVEPSIYKDFILTILFFRYISGANSNDDNNLAIQHGEDFNIIKEVTTKQGFVLPKGASFWDCYEKRYEKNNGPRIDKALHVIEEANGAKLKNIFKVTHFNTDKLGLEKQKNDILCDILGCFGQDILKLDPNYAGSLDSIGNTYEYLINHFAASNDKSIPEFYTPPEVSDLLATILAPQEGDQICDPACGTGSLLIKFGRMIRNNFNDSNKYELFGQEVIGSTWAISIMNMFLHDEYNHRIEWGDTIRHPMLLKRDGNALLDFDIVAANPPFSLDNWGYKGAANDKFDRFHRGLPPKTKGIYAFISHMIETLKPESGRMGIVVPHGVLFRASSEGEIRKKLIKENLLDTVIGLPEKLFFGTDISAAILLFKKQKTDNKVLFIDASREFKSNKSLNQLTPENIQKVIDTYKARKTTDKYSYLATFDEIKENEFNLNISRYVDIFEEEAEINLAVVQHERIKLQNDLKNLEADIQGYLKELGYNK